VILCYSLCVITPKTIIHVFDLVPENLKYLVSQQKKKKVEKPFKDQLHRNLILVEKSDL